MAMPGVFHVQRAVFESGGIAIRVIADFFKGTFVSRGVRDQCPGEMEFIPKEAVSFDRVKSGITDGFIFIRGIGFLFYRHFWMAALKASSRKAIWRTMPRPLVRMANLSA